MANRYDKFQELVVYVAEQFAGDGLGDVKLNKILAFSDFLAYAKLGSSITGADYQRQPMGPVASPLMPARRKLEQAGAVVVSSEEVANGFTRRNTTAKRPAHTEVFSREELAIVDEVIEFVRPHHATSISALSHRFLAGWSLVENGQRIPYDTVFVNTEPPDAAVWDQTKQIAQRLGWNAA